MLSKPQEFIQFHETIEGKVIVLNTSPIWSDTLRVASIQLWKRGDRNNTSLIIHPQRFVILDKLDYKPMMRWL